MPLDGRLQLLKPLSQGRVCCRAATRDNELRLQPVGRQGTQAPQTLGSRAAGRANTSLVAAGVETRQSMLMVDGESCKDHVHLQ